MCNIFKGAQIMTEFNEQKYLLTLIKSGIDPEKAARIAARTAEVQREIASQSSYARPVISAVSAHHRVPALTLQPSNIMPTKKTRKPSAVEALANQVDEVKQTALLKHSKQQMKALQMSLFDIAPWSDNMRALPNDYARSALFTVRNKRAPRLALQNHEIYHVNKDVIITYTGIELRAENDELVWQQVLEYAKRTPMGDHVTFTFYELCQDLGWSINGRYYKKAEECLSRLQASVMQFSSNRIGRLESISLISRFSILDRGKKSSRCQVMIDEEIVVLFAGNHYSKFIWEKYRKLSPTARRMFDYFASHQEPYPLKLETFRLMCGSESTRVKKWREQVGTACEELRDSGLVEHAWLHEDMLHCKR